MLTARNSLPDRVIGLDSGADDYLGKPFGMPELLARLRALTRREGPSKTAELCIQNLILDTTMKRAARNGRVIELTATEYALLEFLMRHERQILSRDQIIDHIWNADFESGSKLIEVYIHYLRRKIDSDHTNKLIHTVRGLGYPGHIDWMTGHAGKLVAPTMASDSQEVQGTDGNAIRLYRYVLKENSSTIIVGISLEPIQRTLQTILLILAGTIPLALLVSGVGSNLPGRTGTKSYRCHHCSGKAYQPG